MKKKSIIVVIGLLIIVVAGGCSGLRKFKLSSTSGGQKAIVEDRQATNSIQNLTDDKLQAKGKSQNTTDSDQEAANSRQETTEDNTQETAIKAQEASSIQNSKDDIQKTKDEKRMTVDDNSDPAKIIRKLVSWGFQKSTGRKIDTIIVHTSYNALGGDVFDKDKVIQEWKDAGVAPHYLIDRKGNIYQLVSDQNIAWHAGAAKTPDGRTDVNSFSLGIEVINTQTEKFSDAQYSGLNSLIAALKGKYSIKYVLGHDEIAPGRKTDPWGIEWKKVDR